MDKTKSGSDCSLMGWGRLLPIRAESELLGGIEPQSELQAVAGPEFVAGGMKTLRQDGIEKVVQGLTDIREIRSVCI